MRVVFYIIILCLLSACRRHAFYYSNYKPSPSSKIDTFELSPEKYDLYIKLICTRSDSLQRGIPCLCDDKSDTIVEEEYMFIEKEPDPKKRRILVINKIPNRNQKFYEETAPQSNIKGLRASDTAIVNIWYFNQFRYGIFYDENSASFITLDAKSEIELWKLQKQRDHLHVTEILGKYTKGYSFVSTDLALSPPPIFTKQPIYKIVLQSFEKDAPRFTLNNRTFYVENFKRKKKVTFMRFDEAISGKDSAAHFKANRVYAYPLLQNNITRTPATY